MLKVDKNSNEKKNLYLILATFVFPPPPHHPVILIFHRLYDVTSNFFSQKRSSVRNKAGYFPCTAFKTAPGKKKVIPSTPGRRGYPIYPTPPANNKPPSHPFSPHPTTTTSPAPSLTNPTTLATSPNQGLCPHSTFTTLNHPVPTPLSLHPSLTSSTMRSCTATGIAWSFVQIM